MKIQSIFDTKKQALAYLLARGWDFVPGSQITLWHPGLVNHRRTIFATRNAWKIDAWTIPQSVLS